ncbi:hypothetical protein [Streptomyces alkaliterrae]|uniref:Uncharacterized protein n=1 Tax=Streptomyces alkaliterrae TaxID=2213162 RepID=A0A5P0YPP9_9ACTN|nr:hypothetical protein [Streptomyces alkaliterrae]MBB1252661.1 hypothetical protein [Streptomyces alkaliterrae]MBB1258000.1 hypothetical protein [Streptomyces alkaliterrae]MQS01402.1 hypothetical protein [Streptomyces alkaliterrae]
MSTTAQPRLSALCTAARSRRDDAALLFHSHCPGPTEVRTHYDEVALTLHCDCPCHRQEVVQ